LEKEVDYSLFVLIFNRIELKATLFKTFNFRNVKNRQSIGRFNRRVIKKVKINYGK